MPLTTCCWNQDSTLLFVGAIDGAIRCLDTNSGQFYDIGMHKSQQPLNYMSFLADKNVLLTTAYDTEVNFWQVGTFQGPINSIELPKKVFKAHCNKNMFCAGMYE
jgi:WD40 repeat protein